MNIFYNIAENSGVGYYRQYLPALGMKAAGHNVLINDFTWGENRIFCKTHGYKCEFIVRGYDNIKMVDEYAEHLKKKHKVDLPLEEKNKLESSIIAMVEPDIQTLGKIGAWADIIIFGRRDTAEYLSTWGGIGEHFNIPIVMDNDDNIYATRPYNPGYRGYHPGSEALHWHKQTVQQVNACTVSTDNLRSVNLRDNPEIYVIPNSIESDRWEKAPKPNHDEIRIGCILSSSHHEDAKLLEQVIPAVLEKYPNAHFYYTSIFTYVFQKALDEFPDRVHPIGWIPLKNFAEEVSALGLDIALAPLVDNFFNRAKSNLRFLEMTAAGAATVVSPVEPYKIVTDGETGMVATSTQDWIDKISLLVEDETLRKKIASQAWKYVKTNFDYIKNAKIASKAYKEIIANFKKKHGKPKANIKPYFGTSSISQAPIPIGSPIK